MTNRLAAFARSVLALWFLVCGAVNAGASDPDVTLGSDEPSVTCSEQDWASEAYDSGPSWYSNQGFFSGGDFLLVRPHFSEAVAFARGTQTLTSLNTVAEPLEFNYDAALRAFVGYRVGPGEGEIRLNYWHLEGETNVAAGNPGPGRFIVDPFGSLVGAVAIVDPSDNRFGTVLIGGDSIVTRATVQLNIFDLDLGTTACLRNPNWALDMTAGVRIANVDQFYESIIRDANGGIASQGNYNVSFTGAGPRAGLSLRRVFGADDRFSLYAGSHAGLVLGRYNVAFAASPIPGFVASQTESMTRMVPVLDGELGGTWKMSDRLTLSSGWLFQSWFDLGTSGGNFSGLFSGADDANIMGFDGLFVRGELAF